MIQKSWEKLYALLILSRANILRTNTLGFWSLAEMSLATGKSKENTPFLKDLTEIGIVYRIGDTRGFRGNRGLFGA